MYPNPEDLYTWTQERHQQVAKDFADAQAIQAAILYRARQGQNWLGNKLVAWGEHLTQEPAKLQGNLQ